jgi:hypothetical protein
MQTKERRKTYDRDFKMLTCCQAVLIHRQFGTKPYIGEINTRQNKYRAKTKEAILTTWWYPKYSGLVPPSTQQLWLRQHR